MNIILKIIVILLLIFLIIGISLSIYASRICKSECLNRGTKFYDLIRSGNLDIDDLCVCYFPNNKIESFILK